MSVSRREFLKLVCRASTTVALNSLFRACGLLRLEDIQLGPNLPTPIPTPNISIASPVAATRVPPTLTPSPEAPTDDATKTRFEDILAKPLSDIFTAAGDDSDTASRELDELIENIQPQIRLTFPTFNSPLESFEMENHQIATTSSWQEAKSVLWNQLIDRGMIDYAWEPVLDYDIIVWEDYFYKGTIRDFLVFKIASEVGFQRDEKLFRQTLLAQIYKENRFLQQGFGVYLLDNKKGWTELEKVFANCAVEWIETKLPAAKLAPKGGRSEMTKFVNTLINQGQIPVGEAFELHRQSDVMGLMSRIAKVPARKVASANAFLVATYYLQNIFFNGLSAKDALAEFNGTDFEKINETLIEKQT